MDIKQLEYFVAVVEEGGITAAARRLFMSQPPITAQMKRLESELDCILFARGARSIRLTDEGRLLYDRAKTLLELERNTREEIAQSVAGGGTLRLGAVSSVAGSLLPSWLGGFHAQHPAVRFELYEGNTYQLLEKLRAGIVEVALVRTPFPAERLICMDISTEKLIAAGEARLLPQGDCVTLDQLAQLPLLVYRRWEHIAAKMFADRGLTPNFVCKSDSAEITVRMVQQGMGVGVLPQSGARQIEGGGIVIKTIANSDVDTTITAVNSDRATLSATAQEFLQWMQNNK